jgi:hypothetical protein
MRRLDLRHIARAIRAITGAHEAVDIGSQAVLGTFDETLLPEAATLSREADVAFWDDPDNEISDRLDGAIGELSQFDSTYGYTPRASPSARPTSPEDGKTEWSAYRGSRMTRLSSGVRRCTILPSRKSVLIARRTMSMSQRCSERDSCS